MNRNDLQLLTDTRVVEAGILLAAYQYSGAYYLAGYAVECALKSVICQRVREFDFPDKKLAGQVHTHDLEALVRFAGLSLELQVELTRDEIFAGFWRQTVNWSEESRYRILDPSETVLLVNAVGNTQHGVLTWIKRFW